MSFRNFFQKTLIIETVANNMTDENCWEIPKACSVDPTQLCNSHLSANHKNDIIE